MAEPEQFCARSVPVRNRKPESSRVTAAEDQHHGVPGPLSLTPATFHVDEQRTPLERGSDSDATALASAAAPLRTTSTFCAPETNPRAWRSASAKTEGGRGVSGTSSMPSVGPGQAASRPLSARHSGTGTATARSARGAPRLESATSRSLLPRRSGAARRFASRDRIRRMRRPAIPAWGAIRQRRLQMRDGPAAHEIHLHRCRQCDG